MIYANKRMVKIFVFVGLLLIYFSINSVYADEISPHSVKQSISVSEKASSSTKSIASLAPHGHNPVTWYGTSSASLLAFSFINDGNLNSGSPTPWTEDLGSIPTTACSSTTTNIDDWNALVGIPTSPTGGNSFWLGGVCPPSEIIFGQSLTQLGIPTTVTNGCYLSFDYWSTTNTGDGNDFAEVYVNSTLVWSLEMIPANETPSGWENAIIDICTLAGFTPGSTFDLSIIGNHDSAGNVFFDGFGLVTSELSLQKTSPDAFVAPGDTIDYTITVENRGDVPATTTITDVFPTGSIGTVSCNCNIYTPSLTVNDSNSYFAFSFYDGATNPTTFTIDTSSFSIPSWASVTNIEVIVGIDPLNGSWASEANPVTITPPSGSCYSGQPFPFDTSDTSRLEFTACNPSLANAVGTWTVSVSDTFDDSGEDGGIDVSINFYWGGTRAETTSTCSGYPATGNINDTFVLGEQGVTATYTCSAPVLADYCSIPSIDNTAQASAPEVSLNPPDSTVSTPVACTNLLVDKSSVLSSDNTGITYTIAVQNMGNAAADITTTDTFPAGVTIDSCRVTSSFDMPAITLDTTGADCLFVTNPGVISGDTATYTTNGTATSPAQMSCLMSPAISLGADVYLNSYDFMSYYVAQGTSSPDNGKQDMSNYLVSPAATADFTGWYGDGVVPAETTDFQDVGPALFQRTGITGLAGEPIDGIWEVALLDDFDTVTPGPPSSPSFIADISQIEVVLYPRYVISESVGTTLNDFRSDVPVGATLTYECTGTIGGGVEISKSPDNQTVTAGNNANFTITVTNTTGADVMATITDPLVPACDNTATFPVGVSTYTCTDVGVTSSYVNTINLSADLALNNTASASAPSDPASPVSDSVLDTITYADSDTATVTVLANSTPVANDDTYITAMNRTLNMPASGVLSNDIDSDGDSLTATLNVDVASGTLTLNADGSFTFVPATDFTGDVTFTYHANDGTVDSNIATVTITVVNVVINEVMQNPRVVADGDGEWLELYNAGTQDVDINGWILADDDTDSHTINNGGALILPVGDYLVLCNNGDSGFNGGVVCDYTYSSYTLANADDEVRLLAGSLNMEMDRVAYTGVAPWSSPNGASMCLTDVTLNNNNGSNWEVSVLAYGDGDLGTPGTANLDCPPPATANDGYTTDEDTPLSVSAPGVMGNDSGATTATLDSGPSSGTLLLQADGSFVYTPTLDFYGTVTFTYSAGNGVMTDTATVTIDVLPVNDAPTATDDSTSTSETVPVMVDVLANDSDSDGGLDASSVMVTTPPISGTTSVDSSTGMITFTPTVGFTGMTTFTYQVCDTGTPLPAQCDTAIVTITVNSCQTPLGTPATTITRLTATDMMLSWSPMADAVTYHVWYGVDEPYFTPSWDCSAPGGYSCWDTGGATSFMASHLGDPAGNYYYYVVGVNECRAVSSPSNDTAEFDFMLVPGS